MWEYEVMSSKSFKVSREELERIIQICENIEKRGLDPFTVNVRALLEKLRKLLEESGDLEPVSYTHLTLPTNREV